MNDIKPSGMNIPGVARAAEPGNSAVTASLPTTAASSESVSNSTVELIKAQDVEKAKVVEIDKKQKAPSEQLNEAVTKLNDYIQSVQRNLQFNVDDDSGKMVVRVVDRNTNEVIRQIPDDMALKMAQNLHQDEPLSLFTMKV